jgi:hypothetical protein
MGRPLCLPFLNPATATAFRSAWAIRMGGRAGTDFRSAWAFGAAHLSPAGGGESALADLGVEFFRLDFGVCFAAHSVPS